jgi:hypothetical protein
MSSRIALLLLLCLALAGCRPATRAHIDPNLAAFIPSDTLALAGIHVAKLRATSLYRTLASEHRLPHFDPFNSETGIDPVRDIRELLLANDGKNTLVMARGTFETAPAAPKISVYQGYTLYGNGGNAAFTPIDKSTVLGGPVAAVRAAIDRYKNGNRGSAALLIARAEALPASAQIWAVAQGWTGFAPGTLREMGNAANLNRILQSVADASLTTGFDSGVHAEATLDCRTEQDSKMLAETLRAMATLGRLGVPKNEPDLLRAFDGIQVIEQARSVRVTVDIPEDVAEKLASR